MHKRKNVRFLTILIKVILLTFGAALLLVLIARLVTGLLAHPRTYTIDDVPGKRVAIVFGAGLWRDGSATPVLEDRVATAVELYRAGKVDVLLMSGDNRFIDYNEPAVMRDLALALGVPAEKIVLDFAGRRTYDTCYRARDIFQVQSAILVTQAFHLPRALYLCNQLGVEGVGVEAEGHAYRKSTALYWNLRELLATINSIWEINFSHPIPVLGDPEPIFKED